MASDIIYIYTGKGHHRSGYFVKLGNETWRMVHKDMVYRKERNLHFDRRVNIPFPSRQKHPFLDHHENSLSPGNEQVVSGNTEDTNVKTVSPASPTLTSHPFLDHHENSLSPGNEQQVVSGNTEDTNVKTISPASPTLTSIPIEDIEETNNPSPSSSYAECEEFQDPVQSTRNGRNDPKDQTSPQENMKAKRIKHRCFRSCCWFLILGSISFVLFGGILAVFLKNNESLHEEINNNKAEVLAVFAKNNNTNIEFNQQISDELSALKEKLLMYTKRRCLTSCENTSNGDYQSCSTCAEYITCSNHITYINSCAPSEVALKWDDFYKECRHTSTTCI